MRNKSGCQPIWQQNHRPNTVLVPTHRHADVAGEVILELPHLAGSSSVIRSRDYRHISSKININALERIDRMILTMEARRNAAYREAASHRIR